MSDLRLLEYTSAAPPIRVHHPTAAGPKLCLPPTSLSLTQNPSESPGLEPRACPLQHHCSTDVVTAAVAAQDSARKAQAAPRLDMTATEYGVRVASAGESQRWERRAAQEEMLASCNAQGTLMFSAKPISPVAGRQQADTGTCAPGADSSA